MSSPTLFSPSRTRYNRNVSNVPAISIFLGIIVGLLLYLYSKHSTPHRIQYNNNEEHHRPIDSYYPPTGYPRSPPLNNVIHQ